MQDLWNLVIFPTIFIVGLILFVGVYLLTKLKLTSNQDHGPRERLQSMAMNIMLLLFLVLNGSSYNAGADGLPKLFSIAVPILVLAVLVALGVMFGRFALHFMSFSSDADD